MDSFKSPRRNMGTLGSFLVIFSTFVTVVTFGTPDAFWYTEENQSDFA